MSEPSEPTIEERELINGIIKQELPDFELLEATSIPPTVSDSDSPAPDERSGVFVSPDVTRLRDHFASVFPDNDQRESPPEFPWDRDGIDNPLPERDGWFCRVRKAGSEGENSPSLAVVLSMRHGVIAVQTGT
jgi:hypothetical protein